MADTIFRIRILPRLAQARIRDAKLRAALAIVSLMLAGTACGIAPVSALAEDIDTDPQADEFQQEVERTAAEYDDAMRKVAEATEALDQNRARMEELEEQIPEQEARSSVAVREQYKLQQQSSGVLELLLKADSFYDFLQSFEYIDRISSANIEEMNRLTDMQAELDETEGMLRQAKRDADENAQRAEEALSQAKAAREEAQRRAQEEARRQAEAAAAAAAAEEQRAAEAEQAAEQASEADDEPSSSAAEDEPAKSQEETADQPETEPAPTVTPADDGADWTAEQSAFISEWSARIDAYLEGSPMAGQGKVFASAAWTYGVDPRWSPAIACTESSKGAACFNPHNAWGWGSESWGSWEEAIDAHVRGLARGYGYTISIDAAKKYCPPNWQKWYDNTSAQMNLI